ncbi:MAG TPA: hypothetical protein VME63_02590 [Dyella sp.]|uniref:hypothetical protein n=1 Tax=Dyella sp. TaxID=1869338 RepID=UPI002C5714F3|nr:hypothetical protein [Dyella sp.]HTV84263.1 hypothetical protein [Dyella sp.]
MSLTRTLLLAGITVAISSCATTSSVVSIGGGRYEVVGHSSANFGTAADQKIDLIVTADEYCSKQGRQMNIEGDDDEVRRAGSLAAANDGGVTGSTAASGQFVTGNAVFSCQ